EAAHCFQGGERLVRVELLVGGEAEPGQGQRQTEREPAHGGYPSGTNLEPRSAPFTIITSPASADQRLAVLALKAYEETKEHASMHLHSRSRARPGPRQRRPGPGDAAAGEGRPRETGGAAQQAAGGVGP